MGIDAVRDARCVSRRHGHRPAIMTPSWTRPCAVR
jgi:hypothetical protein